MTGPEGHLDADAHLPGQECRPASSCRGREAGEQDVVEGFPALPAASMKTARLSFTRSWPTYSSASAAGETLPPRVLFRDAQDPPGCFFRPLSPWLPMSYIFIRRVFESGKLFRVPNAASRSRQVFQGFLQELLELQCCEDPSTILSTTVRAKLFLYPRFTRAERASSRMASRELSSFTSSLVCSGASLITRSRSFQDDPVGDLLPHAGNLCQGLTVFREDGPDEIGRGDPREQVDGQPRPDAVDG